MVHRCVTVHGDSFFLCFSAALVHSNSMMKTATGVTLGHCVFMQALSLKQDNLHFPSFFPYSNKHHVSAVDNKGGGEKRLQRH